MQIHYTLRWINFTTKLHLKKKKAPDPITHLQWFYWVFRMIEEDGGKRAISLPL